MKAYIYTGGKLVPELITDRPKPDDLRIAADGGYKNARLLGERLDLIVGDLDSLDEAELPSGVELIRLKPEKDLTDTQVAVELALERGADDIVIIGGLSGRLDHTLSTLAICEDLCLRGAHCLITDGQSRAQYTNSSLLLPRRHYKYVSLIAATDRVRGVSIEGVRYPLKNATLLRRHQYAVSNEIDGNCCLISLRRGGLFVIESTDIDA